MKFISESNSGGTLCYDLASDIQLILDVFDFTIDDLARILKVDVDSLLNVNNSEPDAEVIDKVFNFAYTNGVRINSIKWSEFQDTYSDSKVKILSHGSRAGIWGDIRVDVSGESNDFSDGFYCGESLRQAGMFVSTEPTSSVYIIGFYDGGLNKVEFKLSTDWMLAVAYYRGRLDDYADHPRIKGIRELVDNCDYLVAPIADNKMFEIIDAFTNGEITDLQCQYALSATYLGNQYVMKTQKAADNCEQLGRLYLCPIEKSYYTHSAEVETNTSINKAIIAKRKYKERGHYISELLSSERDDI